MLTIRRRPILLRMVRQMYFEAIRPFERLYWYIVRPLRAGAKTLIFCEGKVLLVRIGYNHKKWVFPGGGLEREEDPRATAIRETKEETGIVLDDVIYIGERLYVNQYRNVTQHYFTATVTNCDIVIDGQEIIDAGWFALDALPADVAPRVPSEVAMYNDWRLTTFSSQ